jgi:hypothetical protein
MKIAYLLLVHTAPRHLARLIDALTFDSHRFFVHVDAKADICRYGHLPQGRPVEILPVRVPVYWGDFSQVEAILQLLTSALAHPAHFDYFTLISGVDYPIQSNSRIMDFFNRHSGHDFINMVRMPAPQAGKDISRLTEYKRRPGERRFFPPARDYKKIFGGIVPYAGSTWWSLTRETCEKMLAFAHRQTDILEFYKNTACPDEGFFQTAVANSVPHSQIRTNLTYTDWSKGTKSPSELSEMHFGLLGQDVVRSKSVYGEGELLFARKFSDERPDIVDRMDEIIRGKPNLSPASCFPQKVA